jgi:hypothetical protein
MSTLAHAAPHTDPGPRRAPRAPAPRTEVPDVQRALGNRAVGALRGARVQACACGGTCAACRAGAGRQERVQPALAVGPADDVYEREAEQTAERVMRMPAPADAGDPAAADPGDPSRGGAAPAIRRIAAGAAYGVRSDVALPMGGGRPLAPGTRAFMEPRLGADFGGVRLHDGADAGLAAARLGARAFTYGSGVWLGRGESEGDRGLMAHELTHVVQQAGPAPGPQAAPATPPVVRRTLDSDVSRIESLLSYGVFDWAITDSDAIEALEILSNLPAGVQAAVVRRIDLGRLRENLPAAYVPVLDAVLAAAGGAPPADVRTTVERINGLLSYGLFDWAITDADATEALRLLMALPAAEQPRVVLVIEHQRLMDNLPGEDQRAQLRALLEPAQQQATTDIAQMDAFRARAARIVEAIRRQGDALTLPSPPSGGRFERWMSDTYLQAYCATPNETTANPALARMTEEGVGGFTHYGYGLLRGMASAAQAEGIGYIDSPMLLGTPAPDAVTADAFFDPWSQGPNLTQIMHFAAGLKWSHLPGFLVQWYFVHYEQTTEEGWQIFGLDSLNDVIAEEGARILAADMRAGSVRCTGDGLDLDAYFVQGRRFLRRQLSESRLNALALRVRQPVMVVATQTGGQGVVSRPLWNHTVMEQVMAGATDAAILASPDARILVMLYHLLRNL